MELKEYCLEIEKFIKDYFKNNHGESYILGLSGGVDSSLVAALTKKAVGKDKLLCLILPIESNPADALDAIKVAQELDVNYKIVDLTNSYLKMKQEIEDSICEPLCAGSKANLKVRLRMCALYAYAQNNKGFVIGTDNMDERYTGYFTKYGDGGVDLLPIVHLTKAEVVKAAINYGLSASLAKRVPTAGLFDGQTDESEMGVTYVDLDNYLLGGKVSSVVEERIKHLHQISEHKRSSIPSPKAFKRG